MNPQEVWCPNLACPASGQAGQGNIGVHSRKERRYRCHVCAKTFGARTGTPFHRRRTAETLMIIVITLVSWGCPLVAIEHAFGLCQERMRMSTKRRVQMSPDRRSSCPLGAGAWRALPSC